MSENLRDRCSEAGRDAARRAGTMSGHLEVAQMAVDAAWEVVGPELDRLRARLAKVDALADDLLRVSHVLIDKPDTDGEYDTGKALEAVVDDIRAALASVPEPSDSDDVHPATERVSPASWAAVNQIADAHISVPEFRVEFDDDPSDSEHAPDADREAGGE